MKSKENLKTIDLASLAKVLGGVPTGAGSNKPGTVIAQSQFSSFFHS